MKTREVLEDLYERMLQEAERLNEKAPEGERIYDYIKGKEMGVRYAAMMIRVILEQN